MQDPQLKIILDKKYGGYFPWLALDVYENLLEKFKKEKREPNWREFKNAYHKYMYHYSKRSIVERVDYATTGRNEVSLELLEKFDNFWDEVVEENYLIGINKHHIISTQERFFNDRNSKWYLKEKKEQEEKIKQRGYFKDQDKIIPLFDPSISKKTKIFKIVSASLITAIVFCVLISYVFSFCYPIMTHPNSLTYNCPGYVFLLSGGFLLFGLGFIILILSTYIWVGIINYKKAIIAGKCMIYEIWHEDKWFILGVIGAVIGGILLIWWFSVSMTPWIIFVLPGLIIAELTGRKVR